MSQKLFRVSKEKCAYDFDFFKFLGYGSFEH